MPAQRGVTLVELMISLVIGLLVLGGVTYVFFASRTTYTYNETLSRIQENGRIALDSLNFDIRMAGYFGCGKADLIPINVIANTPPVTKIDGGTGIMGYTYGDAQAGFVDFGVLKGVANSDVVVVRRASNVLVNLLPNYDPVNANIHIDRNPDGFKANDVLLITDCSIGDLFRAGNVSQESKPNSQVTVTHASNANTPNTPNRLSKAYSSDAQLMRFLEIAYFVRETDRKTRGGKQVVSFFRRVNGEDQEIVDGVEDLRAFYSTDGVNFRPKESVGAAEWRDVVAVRVHLLLSSQEPTLTEDRDSQFPHDPENKVTDKVKFNDKVMRHEFTQVIALRNRLQ